MKTIYLTDDDEDDRMLVRLAIEKKNRDVRIVDLVCGESLIQAIRDEKRTDFPSVVIIDMNMPRMNGLEIVSQLKADEKCRHIPVVMLSTTSDVYLIHQAYSKGINAFLEKPILLQDFADIAETIDVCFLNTSRQAEEDNKSVKCSCGSIVIIKDNDDQLLMTRRTLKKSMPHVKIFSYINSHTVLADLKNDWRDFVPIPQMIFLDLYIPTRQQGLDLLLEIYQLLMSKSNYLILVVIFTHLNDPTDRNLSYQHNANAFITKNPDIMHWQNDFKNFHRFWWNSVSY